MSKSNSEVVKKKIKINLDLLIGSGDKILQCNLRSFEFNVNFISHEILTKCVT